VSGLLQGPGYSVVPPVRSVLRGSIAQVVEPSALDGRRWRSKRPRPTFSKALSEADAPILKAGGLLTRRELFLGRLASKGGVATRADGF